MRYTPANREDCPRYRCGVGYLPRDIKTWNATCRMRSDGSLYWDIDKFDCRPVSCGHPGDIRWGRLMDAVFVFPRQVRYQCNKGYRMIGDAQLYCQSDGTWNSVKPECQIVDCGPLDGIANGTVQLHSTQYGSKAEFTCNNGFKLTGTSTRTCDADGQWTDESPHCEEIWCPQPDLPEGNGTTSLGANPGSQRSGTRLQYFCPQKTVLVGSEINICQETGSWLFDPPVCTLVYDLAEVVTLHYSLEVKCLNMRKGYSFSANKGMSSSRASANHISGHSAVKTAHGILQGLGAKKNKSRAA
ncbi:hypothetical protein HPB52_002584 [Rhipicephalus sanguineus]|uniref:Sushi domain-containing protein n=1 Tax=Rhipicephalus sanguineus TaxID=34632 RepID=A0A9D4QFQ0_RHISA|nr:hypothetical protein HPB52_002584 [Rhipicephalus sanguineus]